MNYAVKSSHVLSFLESVPEVAAKLKEPSTKEKKFEDVVKEVEQAAVLVLVYYGRVGALRRPDAAAQRPYLFKPALWRRILSPIAPAVRR